MSTKMRWLTKMWNGQYSLWNMYGITIYNIVSIRKPVVRWLLN